MNNETNKLSRSRKRRTGRKNKLNGDMKLLLNKIRTERRRKIKVLVK